MNYIEAKITTTTIGAEAVMAVLDDIACGFSIDDPKDLQDLLNAPVKRWDYIDDVLLQRQDEGVIVKFYLECDETGKLKCDEARARTAKIASQDAENLFGELKFESFDVVSEDWENNWKQYYKPFTVGERLFVRPEWEDVQAKAGQVTMIINPASSFGTGSHATTRLCLEELEKMDLQGLEMLDAGCGSGILATAGMRLGCKNVCACDVEENAMRATLDNLEMNGICKESAALYLGNFLDDAGLEAEIFAKKYGVITANIVSDVLIAMAKTLCDGLCKGGDLIVCGIIEERADEVANAFAAQNVIEIARATQNGWTMIHYTTKDN